MQKKSCTTLPDGGRNTGNNECGQVGGGDGVGDGGGNIGEDGGRGDCSIVIVML